MPTLTFLTPLGPNRDGGTPALITFIAILRLLGTAVRDLHRVPKRVVLLHRSIQKIEKRLLLKSTRSLFEVQLDTRQKIVAGTQPISGQGTAAPGRMIHFNRATIAPSSTADPVLHEVSLELRRKSFTVITGRAGSGKSTLMRAILNRCAVVEGTVDVDARSISLCGQDPWIQNTTFKRNIVGPSEYNHIWYNQVVFRCFLTDDIARFPDGDDEVVGQQGCKLSHSLKHRLALARAVYSRPKLLLLDDIFIAQSAAHAEGLIVRLLSPGTVLRQTTTIVVATQNATLFAQHANAIIKINDEGRLEQVDPRRLPDMQDIEDFVPQLESKSTSPDADSLARFSQEVASQFHTKPTAPINGIKLSYQTLIKRMDPSAVSVCITILVCFGLVEELPRTLSFCC